uniref:E-beta-farnesene synthase n=1 Tax=Tanacetum cinerariifolium TaxID=118510 RepID=A0A6L2JY60_TANCI|nr:hypothetical protein [Tanacetum cinerariifolium]
MLWGIIISSNVDYVGLMWEEFVQAIQTFLTDKANLGSPTKKGKKDKPHVIPYYRFTKLIICHLRRIHNIHQGSAYPFHLAEEDFTLGNLKFVSKCEANEVFGMAIPNKLILNNIRNAPYYNAYLEMVAKHDQKVASKKEGKMKTGSDKQPKSKPAIEKSSKPAHAPKQKETKERPFKASTAKPPKPKPAKEKSTKTIPPQQAGKAQSKPELKLEHQGEGDEDDMERAIQMSLESFQTQSQAHVGCRLQLLKSSFGPSTQAQDDTSTNIVLDSPSPVDVETDESKKPNVEAEVVSMVTIPILQASSSVPPLSTPVPVIDLLPPKPASSTTQAPIFIATTTTTTTSLPPPPQQQSTIESEVFTLELRDLPHKINEAADVEEVLHDREKFIQDTQTFLEKFNRFSFGFTPRVLTIAWERIDKIKYVLSKPEEISELMYKLREDVRNIREELAEYIDSPIWNCPTFFYDEDEEYTIQHREYLEKSPDAVTTILPTKEPEHLFSMGYEHFSITPETESDEVTESNVENLLPIPSKCEVTLEDEIECDMPSKDDCSPVFTTFSNPLFKDNDDLDSSDDESLPDEDVPAEEFKIYSNPLFDEDEINFDKLDPHYFNVESDFVESLLNREEIRLIENLLYDNSFPRPPEELNAEIADTIIESIPLPIPVQDGNSQQEEIDVVTSSDDVLPSSDENDDDSSDDFLLEEADLFLVSDNSIPPGIENFADDPEGDVCFFEELLINDFILSHESYDYNFEDNPLISRPPPEPPNVESFFDLKPDVIAEEISDKLNEAKCSNPGREMNVSTKIEDVDYFPFMFVIRFFLPYFIFPEISPLLLSAESEDTIFDPGISD